MAGKLRLFSMDVSPPCRFVLMTIQSLNLQPEIIEIDLFKAENKTGDYSKINSKQQVPTLIDDQLIITDSHAICTYLVNKHGRGSQLYPEEPGRKSMVDQMLCFNMTHFFPANSAAMSLFFTTREKFILPGELQKKISKSYKLMNGFLQHSNWLAGNEMTLADLCCLATITSSELLVPLDAEEYPQTALWQNRCKETSLHQKGNQPGVDRLKYLMETWSK